MLYTVKSIMHTIYSTLFSLTVRCALFMKIVDAMLGHSDLVNKEFPQHLLDLGVECICV